MEPRLQEPAMPPKSQRLTARDAQFIFQVCYLRVMKGVLARHVGHSGHHGNSSHKKDKPRAVPTISSYFRGRRSPTLCKRLGISALAH